MILTPSIKSLNNPTNNMTIKPDLSIIIVSHNSHNFLRQTLHSVLTQKGLSYEIIVVDNKSNDNTLVMLKQDFPSVKVIKRHTSTGFAAANNLGVKSAKADTILFLNPDITLVNESDLKNCYERLWNEEKLGCLSPKVLLALTDKIDETSHRGFPTPWASFTHFTRLSRLFPNLPIFNHYNKRYLGYDHEHYIDSVGGMFMMVKKVVGEAIGWWDEAFDFYGEDLDFCYRLWEQNYPVLYYPAVTIKHYKGATTGMSKSSQAVTTASRAKTRQVRRWSIDAMKIFYQKHYQAKYPFFINYLVYLGLKFLYFIRVVLK